jgi:hypothetical protein
VETKSNTGSSLSSARTDAPSRSSSYRVIVELISATTTKTGLTVRCELDTGKYPSGIVVSDAEMAAINIKRAEFHRRVELHHLTKSSSPKSRVYFVTDTKRAWRRRQ